MPPKKNKKPSKNGYWQFVLETRDKQTNKHMNMEEIKEYAARKWASMTKEQRQPYETRAQLARENFAATKYTSDGVEIEVIQSIEKEAAAKIEDMKTDINRTLKKASYDSTLGDQIFLIIHLNHLVYYPAGDKFFICEVAIAALNLKDGIKDIYHSIIKPGKLPLGFYGTALAHSKETHQMIELVQDEPYEDTTREVFAEMTYFIKRYTDSCCDPIIYADEKTFEMTNKVIDNFLLEFGYDYKIKIYNLQYMFFALRNAVAGRHVWPTETFSFSELEKDIYGYTANICCEFHELSDAPLYCSKSIVTRYSYTICDHCCADLNIQLEPGFHVPKNAKITVESRVTSKAPSVCSTDDFQSVNRSRINSFGSCKYEDNFPALGARRFNENSSVSSVISFSSMKSAKSSASTSKAATRIEQSFKALSLNDAKRDHKNLKFPEHGYNRRDN